MDATVALAIPVIVLLLIAVLSRESDIDIAVKRTKILDARLEREFNAQGETFEEHVDSAKGLPTEVVNTLHDIRDKRNDLVHKVDRNTLENRKEFIRACNYVEVRCIITQSLSIQPLSLPKVPARPGNCPVIQAFARSPELPGVTV